MAPPSFPYERASTILAEAELYGDKQVSKRWGISDRTIRNYRVRVVSDTKFSALFQLKKQLILTDWQTDATKTLKSGLSKLGELINEDGQPEQIHAVAGAIKIVGELKIQYAALFDEPTPPQQNQHSEAN